MKEDNKPNAVIKTEEPKIEAPKIAFPVSAVILHSAVIIDGRTESTINKKKLPTLRTMGWAANGFFILIANTVHVLPSAAVKDSII